MFCGIVRNCLIRDELPHEHYPQRKITRCGIVFFTCFTLAFSTVTLLTQFEFFTHLFNRFQPYYEIDTNLTVTVKSQIKQLYLARTGVMLYLVVPGILLRVTKYLVGILVLLLLWPVLLGYYFFINRELRLKE